MTKYRNRIWGYSILVKYDLCSVPGFLAAEQQQQQQQSDELKLKMVKNHLEKEK